MDERSDGAVRASGTEIHGLPAVYCLLLTVVCIWLFFYHLASRDLWSSHEARAAQDAQTIVSDGCWGLPRLFDRKIEMQKPPLYYWLVAGIARARGLPVDAWDVRLPAAAAGFGGVFLLFAFGVWRGRALAGLLGALTLATSIHYTWLARTGRTDMPLAFAISATLLAFYLGRTRQKEAEGRGAWWCFLAAYLAAAAAFMLKGPIGVVLPGVTAAVWLWLEGDLRFRRRCVGLVHELGLWWGIPLTLALALPWFVWAGVQTHGALWQTFFWYHNVERAFTDAVGHHANAWWEYGPLLVSGLFPWSLFLPLAGWYLWRTGRLRAYPEAKFGLAWLATITVLLTFVRFKRADYLLPAYPGAALLLGCVGQTWWQARGMRLGPVLVLAGVVLGCCGGWWYYVDRYLPRHEAEQEDRTFAAAIRRLAPLPNNVVIFFRTEAHALAFHVGRPLDTILEWENLDWWAARAETTYVVMPPEIGRDWPRYLRSGRLEEVMRNTDGVAGPRAHPLVLYRTRALPRSPVDRNSQACRSLPSCLPLPAKP